MQSTTAEQKQNIPHEIAKVPAEAGTAIVGGAEAVGHDVTKVVIEGATVIFDATKAVVSDIAMAGEQLGRDVKQSVSPAPEPLTPSIAAAAVAPVAAAPVVAAPVT